jgi:hypothetical protein
MGALQAADERARYENALIEGTMAATTPTAPQLQPWLDYAALEAGGRAPQVRYFGTPLLIMIRTEDEMERHVGGSQPPLSVLIKKYSQRARTVYERALAAWPLAAELWQAYLAFDAASPSSAAAAATTLSLQRRAVRNISWSGTFWCSYLQSLLQPPPAAAAAAPATAPATEAELAFAFELAATAPLGAAADVTAVAVLRCVWLRTRLEAACKQAAQAAAEGGTVRQPFPSWARFHID